jgi:hypothetical protein
MSNQPSAGQCIGKKIMPVIFHTIEQQGDNFLGNITEANHIVRNVQTITLSLRVYANSEDWCCQEWLYPLRPLGSHRLQLLY